MEYFAISLLLMLPAGFIVLGIVIAYLIYNRLKARSEENFERRDN